MALEHQEPRVKFLKYIWKLLSVVGGAPISSLRTNTYIKREQVAELEHEQWMIWAKSIFPELKELTKHHLPYNEEKEAGNCACVTCRRIQRWERECFKPYSELSEEMKDYDRKWANKILEAIEE